MTDLAETCRLRTERYLAANLRKHPCNPQVRPHWVEQSDTFWFRRETTADIVVTVVDATTGRQSAAETGFDALDDRPDQSLLPAPGGAPPACGGLR